MGRAWRPAGSELTVLGVSQRTGKPSRCTDSNGAADGFVAPVPRHLRRRSPSGPDGPYTLASVSLVGGASRLNGLGHLAVSSALTHLPRCDGRRALYRSLYGELDMDDDDLLTGDELASEREQRAFDAMTDGNCRMEEMR